MGGFRAKDADRDRYVDIIEAAYVDGQLGEQDRELRVARALTAETLDELEGLTRDLQPPEGAVVRPPEPSTPAVPAAGRALAVVFVAVAALVLLGIVATGLMAFSPMSGPESQTSTVEISGEPVPIPVEEVEVVEEPSFEMTPGDVRAFLRAYERKFGTLDVWEAAFYPNRVGVQVPVRGSRPRFERWTWDGRWRQDADASAVTGPQRIVDLGAVDVRALFDNIARARTSLDVENGRLTHVLAHDWGDGPSVNIYVGNSVNESGYLQTTPAGDVNRAYPYQS